MTKLLFIDFIKCHGCGICEQFCAARDGWAPNSLPTRIKVIAWDLEGRGVPVTCQQCLDPPCMAICPKDAIYRDKETDRVRVDYDCCIGCRMCVFVCPFGAMNFDPISKRVYKCDLCNGAPICVDMCNYGALQYTEASERATAFAEKIKKTLGDELLRTTSTREPSQAGEVPGFVSGD